MNKTNKALFAIIILSRQSFDDKFNSKRAKAIADIMINEISGFVKKEYDGDWKEFDKNHPYMQDNDIIHDVATLLVFGFMEYRHVKKIIKDALSPKCYWFDLFEYLKDTALLEEDSDEDFEKFIAEVIYENEKAANDVRGGKEKAIQSLVGYAMKKSKGKADPNRVREALRKSLSGE